LLSVITARDPWTRELRHVTPFAGIPTAAERARVYREFARSESTLWIATAIANRPKDVQFCRALATRGLVDATTLVERLAMVTGLDARVRSSVEGRIRAIRA
jgi:hypothetical protein